MASLVKSFRVLSDPTRLRLLRLLRDEELTVAELQEILGMGQSRISASLALVKRAGLVTDRRVGKNIFYRATLPEDSPLWEMEQVIITGHYAGMTPRYNERAMAILLDNLRRYRAGEELRNVVDKQAGY